MTGLVRKAIFFAVCGLLVAGAALANVPSPGNSTCPAVVYAMGTTGAAPGNSHQLASTISGASRQFTIIVRDFTNNPIAGSLVKLHFSSIAVPTFDFHLCDAEPGNEPQQTTVGPSTGILQGTTNALGVFTATIIGGGQVGSPTPVAGSAPVLIEADGVTLCNANMYYANPNGWSNDLVDGVDNSIHFVDFVSPGAEMRSDFNGNAAVDGVDNAETFLIFVQGQSSQGCNGANNAGGVAGGYLP